MTPSSRLQLEELDARITPATLAIADFNGDGVPDIASLDNVSNDIDINLSSLTSTGVRFIRTMVIPFQDLRLDALAVGDLRNNGLTDLVVADAGSNSVLVLLGQGDGTFVFFSQLFVGRNPAGVVLGDFDGDGRLDVAVTNAGSEQVSIRFGNGNGTFGPGPELQTGIVPVAVEIIRVDPIGQTYLVTADLVSNSVSLFRAFPDRTFGPGVTIPAGRLPESMQVIDLNRDGIPDVVVQNATQEATILLGTITPDGQYLLQPGPPLPLTSGIAQIVAADCTGDGIPDLVTLSPVTGQFSLLRGQGDGTFTNSRFAIQRVSPPAGGVVVGITAIDLLGNGRFEVIQATTDRPVAFILTPLPGPPPLLPLGRTEQIERVLLDLSRRLRELAEAGQIDSREFQRLINSTLGLFPLNEIGSVEGILTLAQELGDAASLQEETSLVGVRLPTPSGLDRILAQELNSQLNQTFQSRLGISTTTDTLDSAPSSRMTAPPPPTREAAAAAAASLMPTRQTQGPVIPIDLQAGDAVAELTPLGGESLLPVATLAGGRLGEVAEPLPQRPPDPEMFGIFSPPAPISAMPQIIDPWTAFGLAALALAARQNRLAERTRPANDGR